MSEAVQIIDRVPLRKGQCKAHGTGVGAYMVERKYGVYVGEKAKDGRFTKRLVQLCETEQEAEKKIQAMRHGQA